MARRDDIEVRISGSRIAPANVDARAALELAAAYFDLLARVADEKIGEPLEFRGLSVVPGSLRIVSSTPNPAVALEAADFTAQLLRGGGARFGFTDNLKRLHRAVRAFPDEIKIEGIVDGHARPIELEGARETPAYEESTLRAKLLRVGGKRPSARFESGSEVRPFTLELSMPLAQRLGLHLYKPVEITFRALRDEDGCIAEGRLTDFEPVELSEDPFGVVRDWADESGTAAYWSRVRSLEKELRGEED